MGEGEVADVDGVVLAGEKDGAHGTGTGRRGGSEYYAARRCAAKVKGG